VERGERGEEEQQERGPAKGSVETKQDYYRRSETLEFGNKLQVWPDFWSWRCSGYKGGIRFRSRARASGAFTLGPPIPFDDVPSAYYKLLDEGYSESELLFCEAALHEFTVIQGEVCRSSRGLELTWSIEPGITVREAMTRAKYSSGLAVKLILESRLDPVDYEDLMELLDTYPDHVVEFSVFSTDMGVLGRRMVVWEVRRY
jgi:hypothetical protein